MGQEISIRHGCLDDVIAVDSAVVEFGYHHSRDEIERRTEDKNRIYVCAYSGDEAIGYLTGYDRFADGSYYCWMAGVKPEHRGKGVLKQLMTYLEDWARQEGYTKLCIKTRNRRREMLRYLVTYGFNFRSVTQKNYDIEDYRITLEKNI